MIFDTETAILARLAAKCAPGSVLLGTFDPVDVSDDAASPVVGKLTLMQISATGAVHGSTAASDLYYGFSVYCDVYRASAGQKTAAAALLESAGNALVGWEYAGLRTPTMQTGQPTEFDGRLLRLSIGFSIPAYFVGT